MQQWLDGEAEIQCQAWHFEEGTGYVPCAHPAQWLAVVVSHNCKRRVDETPHRYLCTPHKDVAAAGEMACGSPCYELIKLRYIERIK